MSVSAAADDVSLSGLEPNTNGDKIMGRDLRVMTTRVADITHNEPCLSVIDTDWDHYNESDAGPDIRRHYIIRKSDTSRWWHFPPEQDENRKYCIEDWLLCPF